MADVAIAFIFKNSINDETWSVEESFDATEGFESDVDEFIQQWIDDNSDGEESDYELEDYNYSEWDDEYGDPTDWETHNEYGEYVDLIDEHGQGFRLRFEDIGTYDSQQFQDEYEGEWHSEEEFAQNLFESLYDIPDHLANHIDWDSVTSEVMRAYSSYQDDNGTIHIFRDC